MTLFGKGKSDIHRITNNGCPGNFRLLGNRDLVEAGDQPGIGDAHLDTFYNSRIIINFDKFTIQFELIRQLRQATRTLVEIVVAQNRDMLEVQIKNRFDIGSSVGINHPPVGQEGLLGKVEFLRPLGGKIQCRL